MEFELPLTEKQKEDILNEVSTVGKLGPAIMIFINLLPELLTIALMIGIFNLQRMFSIIFGITPGIISIMSGFAVLADSTVVSTECESTIKNL